MDIACTTVYDPKDPAAFGGRTYFQIQALQSQSAAMHFIGPLSKLKPPAAIALAKREFYRITNKRYYPSRDRIMVKEYSRQIARRLTKLHIDIVFSPESECSQPVAYLDCKQPIVTWTDAPWAAVVDFYPEYSSDLICAESLRDAVENERAALSRVAMAIYWCEWGAQAAIRCYGVDPARIRVIPPGPALAADQAIAFEEAKHVVSIRPKDQCRLLFVGIEWARKGGDIVVEVARRLNAAGLPTEVLVVGCDPPNQPLPEFVRAFGYISRASKDGKARLNELFKTSHFLFMPSRAEAFGLVFAEANAFALPSLATEVGGIPEIVRSGVNGATFPLSANPDLYCDFLENCFFNWNQYEQLALSAMAEFHTRLNNQAAAASIINTLQQLL
jgi:glycosyltransferase involved in cell wall biosynthesis